MDVAPGLNCLLESPPEVMEDRVVAEMVADPVEGVPGAEKTAVMSAEIAVISLAIADVEAVAGNFHSPCVLSRNGEVTSSHQSG